MGSFAKGMMCAEMEKNKTARHPGKFNKDGEKGAEKEVAGNKSSEGSCS